MIDLSCDNAISNRERMVSNSTQPNLSEEHRQALRSPGKLLEADHEYNKLKKSCATILKKLAASPMNMALQQMTLFKTLFNYWFEESRVLSLRNIKTIHRVQLETRCKRKYHSHVVKKER